MLIMAIHKLAADWAGIITWFQENGMVVMNFKSPILPHLALWGTFMLIVVVGVATNSGAVGALIGVSVALASDPILLISALLTGTLTKDYKKF